MAITTPTEEQVIAALDTPAAEVMYQTYESSIISVTLSTPKGKKITFIGHALITKIRK